MHDGRLLQRLPFVELYSLLQSSCLLFTYSCWELDLGMMRRRRSNSIRVVVAHWIVAMLGW